MENTKFGNRIMAKYTEIADIIREHGKISFGRLTVLCHIAPSTLHGYWKAMRDLFPDLKYEGGVFMSTKEKHHRMPDAKLVPPR